MPKANLSLWGWIKIFVGRCKKGSHKELMTTDSWQKVKNLTPERSFVPGYQDFVHPPLSARGMLIRDSIPRRAEKRLLSKRESCSATTVIKLLRDHSCARALSHLFYNVKYVRGIRPLVLQDRTPNAVIHVSSLAKDSNRCSASRKNVR